MLSDMLISNARINALRSSDPRVVPRLTQSRPSTGDQGLLVKRRTEVSGLGIGYNFASVMRPAEYMSDEFLEPELFRAAHFERAVLGATECDFRQNCDYVAGQDRLNQRAGRDSNGVAVAGGLRNGTAELE